MEEKHAVDARLLLARRFLQAGQARAAIEQLRHVLGDDPENATAHALLSHALVDDNRIYAGEREAGLALAHAPEDGEGHRAMARVKFAQRRLDEALEATERAEAIEPLEPATFVIRAGVLAVLERSAEARAALERALELDPESDDARWQLGVLCLDEGKIDEAERWARAVLEGHPEHIGAGVLMGRALLRRGDVAAAREHALTALRENASHEGALFLLASVKTRENPFLGAWWHLNTRLSELGGHGEALALIGAFVAVRLVSLILADTGHPAASELVRTLWLGVCAYSWVAPGIFRKMLEAELQKVRLRDDF